MTVSLPSAEALTVLMPRPSCGPGATDFLAAERLLAAAFPSEVELYDAVHAAAKALVPTDAFYVCLVRHDPEGLYFVYNCEGEHFDTPEPYPMGDGPTSRVARSGRPVVMVLPEHRDGMTTVRFADATTQSGSAVHWPLWIDADPLGLPDGVLSVQSYSEGAYGAEAVAAIEWLSLRAAEAMRRRGEGERTRRSEGEIALAAARARAVEDVRRFVEILHGLAALQGDPKRQLAEIRRRQVELTQWAPTSPVPDDPLSSVLAALSDRELEVLAYVAQGLSTKEVAQALSIAPNTVKRHLDNVYARGALTRRAEVTNAAGAIQYAWMARKGA